MLSSVAVPRTSRLIVAAFLVAGIAGWVACGSTTPQPQVTVATQNTKVAMDPTVTSSVIGTTFTFPGGAGAFAPAVANQNLTLSFGGSASALTSSGQITSPSGATVGTFTSTVSFGSCDFTITAVTGNPGVTVGQVIRIDPCNIVIQTNGVVTGANVSTAASLVFGTTTSQASSVVVEVDGSGKVTVNGTPVGTVTTGKGSGTTGTTGTG